jgi:hypothetical protein
MDLQAALHQPDFVEEDRPAMGELRAGSFACFAVGETTAFEPEALGLEQRVWNCRTVDVDER